MQCKVRTNLDAALRQPQTMEHFQKSLKIWIDALCINQTDNKEKGEQVAKMGSIYKQAGNLIVWLGTNSENGENAKAIDRLQSISVQYRTELLEAMDDIEDLIPAHQHREKASWKLRTNLQEWKDHLHNHPDYFSDEDYIRIYNFFNLPYWRRLWIIQELSMGGPGMPIICGTKVTQWRYIRDASLMLSEVLGIVLEGTAQVFQNLGHPNIERAEHSVEHVAIIAQVEIHRHRKRLPPIDKNLLDFHSTPGPESIPQPLRASAFKQALRLSWQAEVEKPRDRIYGMLELPGMLYHGMAPDYNLDDEIIFKFFAELSILTPFEPFEILSIIDGIPPADPKTPSWVPNMAASSRRRAAPIDGLFSAGGPYNITIMPTFSQDPPRLTMPGFVVDKVDGLGAIQSLLRKHMTPQSSFVSGIVQPSEPHLDENVEGVKFSIWTTLIAGANSQGLRPSRYFSCLLHAFTKEQPAESASDFFTRDLINPSAGFLIAGKRLKLWFEFRDRPYAFTNSDPSLEAEAAAAKQTMRMKTKCRRLMVTKNRGFLGLVPMATQAHNDLVAILLGHPKPVIIRPYPDGDREQYQLIGECYVHGLMQEHHVMPIKDPGTEIFPIVFR
jgi:Heterokaryon incompatibility protein (HET)